MNRSIIYTEIFRIILRL